MRVKTLFPLFLFLSISTVVVAQYVSQPDNGVDPYPVYKSNLKNAYIDSIIYQDIFVVFCISFEEPVAKGTYELAASTSKKTWMAFTYDGYKKPLVIRNVRSNGVLIADVVKKKGVTVPLKAREGATTAKLSCQLQFLRRNFLHQKTEIVLPVEDKKQQNKRAVIFDEIRLRKNNINHALSPALVHYYEKDYPWSEEVALKKSIVTINDQPIQPSWKKSPSHSTTALVQPLSYKVEPVNESYLFLEGVQHTPNASIFKIYTYANPMDYLHLYNNNREGFVIKAKGKRIKMKSIQNIRVNGALIKTVLQKKENLSIEQGITPYILSFEVHFERLPDDIGSFDLLEIFRQEGRAFSFYEVGL